MPKLTIHPTTCLLVWLLLLLVVQLLSGTTLAAALLLLPALGTAVLQRGSGLVRRARWLLLSLLVVFSWGIPGDPLWNGALSPTYEGLFEGLTHLGRLVLVLMAVAAFLEAMSLQDLLAATHALLGPLRRLGFDPDRSVVRLMLVLRYVETLPRPRDWRALLDLPATNLGEVVEIGYQPFRWPDFVVVLTLAIAFLLYLYR
ncbi:CbiQ family ECF transporter T component [Propionivibrio sp.]|uniref:CbiQ family ECF transporter T component n=1 Tax=Propionivibrio sp. TaxID=2212460 RepID=UPI0025D6C773|nr:CbiQ family ECF transporter T component [Propionivibrio sp.]MBK7356730.1 hypothetical protein [Propionivibrio sp.]MBK8401135.1 hypothetical protein [Propionivibrio sp.]MBK8743668.1 hypothetical protein [Propionivibrio sp.]MBK8894907.1 hypothetical protein [Propionivibrio sp.]